MSSLVSYFDCLQEILRHMFSKPEKEQLILVNGKRLRTHICAAFLRLEVVSSYEEIYVIHDDVKCDSNFVLFLL